MININQLLESVDLDFEPRFVTKDKNGYIEFWSNKPKSGVAAWYHSSEDTICQTICKLKLSEFEGKDWTECIYEVPRKTDEYEQNLEKLRPADSDLVYRVKLPRKTTGKIEKLNLLNDSALLWGKKINELVDMVNNIISVQEKMIDSRFVVDAVNELKGANQ